MPTSCPKCSKDLPEVETLKYRFCPHCGAEIAAAPAKLDSAMRTIPPDLSEQPSQPRAAVLGPQPDENVSGTTPFDDQTGEPQPVVKRSRPKINPPDTPPPTSFFRVSAVKKTNSIRSAEEVASKNVIEKQPSTKNRTVIIVGLIILAIIIVVLGGLFTF